MTECFTKQEVCDILNQLQRHGEVARGYETYIGYKDFGDYFSVDDVAEAFGLETNCTEIFIPTK
mgnify:CR=1 FL=1